MTIKPVVRDETCDGLFRKDPFSTTEMTCHGCMKYHKGRCDNVGSDHFMHLITKNHPVCKNVWIPAFPGIWRAGLDSEEDKEG